jgi:hypothetical protein
MNVGSRGRHVEERGVTAVAAHGEAAVWRGGDTVDGVAQLFARDDVGYISLASHEVNSVHPIPCLY